MKEQFWYKRTSWSKEDREDYFSHLKKARGNAPIYIQIQAEILQQSGDTRLIDAALELLEISIKEWPNDLLLPQIYLQKAQCLASQGKISEVVTAFRNSIEANRTRPHIQTEARSMFALFVLKNELTEYYSEILSLLKESKNIMIFPIQKFLIDATSAILLDYEGNKSSAMFYAQSALKACNINNSGLLRRSTLGLVKNPEDWIINHLNKIAGIE